jgi:phosphotransferase system enzyme I (PtsP)
VHIDLATQVQIAADEMGVDLASLYLFENNQLVLRATFGLTEESVGRVRMQLNEGLTGLVFTSGRVLPVSEPAQHPRYRFFPASGEEEFHSYLGVPLPEALGVLVFQTRASHFYSQAEVRAATLWAQRMAQGLLAGKRVA